MARVLVADDVKDVRDLLKVILIQDGHEVVEAETGKKVISLLEDDSIENFDLILLDIGLPDIDGTEVMRLISAMEKDTPKVCFVSGEKDKEVVVRALQAGGSDYIVKPIDIVVLRSKLGKFLGGDAQPTITVDAELVATLPDFPMDLEVVITKLSELGLEFRSSMPFKEGSSLNLQSSKMDSLTGAEFIFPCLIESVAMDKKTSHHGISCSFSGMHESQRIQLRKLLISGNKISDS